MRTYNLSPYGGKLFITPYWIRARRKKMAIKENDARRIGWEIAEKVTDELEIQGKIARDVANGIWTNLYPDKEPWKKIPQKP
jgi:hypothetical protein